MAVVCKSTTRYQYYDIDICGFTCELSTSVSVGVCFFFSMPHEICIREVKGTRRWRLFSWRAFCVDVLVNITIVAVKRLIEKSNHDKRSVNCQ